MTDNHSKDSWLIADVGATSCRCGIYSATEKSINAVQVYTNDKFASFDALLTNYLDSRSAPPTKCALAIAAPIDGDQAQMMNRAWTISGTEIARQFDFNSVELMNDFQAIAYGLPEYAAADRIEIGRATRYRSGTIAALGPGSGLGMSAWIKGHSASAVMSGEGGHITLAGRNAGEEKIIGKFRERYGHCSAERVLSGPGLIALHSAMHSIELASSKEITANADDPLCAATLNQFFCFLGATAAELALMTGASGIYVAGGIVPANVEALQKSDFRSRFESKNRYVDYMRAIPTWVITAPEPGLLGLAAYIDQAKSA